MRVFLAVLVLSNGKTLKQSTDFQICFGAGVEKMTIYIKGNILFIIVDDT